MRVRTLRGFVAATLLVAAAATAAEAQMESSSRFGLSGGISSPIGDFGDAAELGFIVGGHWSRALGETRPAWKVLRVLANLMQLPGFDFDTSEQVRDHLLAQGVESQLNNAITSNPGEWRLEDAAPLAAGQFERLADVPADRLETTLLIPPQVLVDFAEYNDFLEVAEDTVAELELEGIIQVASFHPQYQFAGTEPDDIDNATNRSPWPTLHLFREDSIDRAVEAFPEAEAIYETNIETMRRLGATGWAELQRQCRADAGALGKPHGGSPRRPR